MRNRTSHLVTLLALLASVALACQATSLFAPQPSPTHTPAPPPTAVETALPSPTPTRQPYGENIELLRLLDASLPGFDGGKDYRVFGRGLSVIDVAVQGERVYVLFGADGPAGFSWGAMSIVDLSGHYRPEVMGSYRSKLIPTDIKLIGNTAFLTDANCEFGAVACYGLFYIIDVSDPLNPATLGSYALEDLYRSSRHLQSWLASSVDIEGNFAYVTGRSSTPPENSRETALRVVDISDPANPRLAGVLESPVEQGLLPGLAVDVQDRLAYLASGNLGLRVIDVADPANLAEVGYLEDIGNVLNLVVDGDFAYLATQDSGLRIVDISNPFVPTLVSFLPVAAPVGDIAIEDGIVCLAAGEAGVRVVDISYPTSPREIGYFITPMRVVGVDLQDGKIYAADYETGLYVLQLIR